MELKEEVVFPIPKSRSPYQDPHEENLKFKMHYGDLKIVLI